MARNIDSVFGGYTYKDKYHSAAELMENIGGSFAKQIALAFFHADSENTIKLVTAFQDLFDKYLDMDNEK